MKFGNLIRSIVRQTWITRTDKELDLSRFKRLFYTWQVGRKPFRWIIVPVFQTDLRWSALLFCGDLREILFPGLLMQDSRCFTQIYADLARRFSQIMLPVDMRWAALPQLARMSHPCKEFNLSKFKRLFYTWQVGRKPVRWMRVPVGILMEENQALITFVSR